MCYIKPHMQASLLSNMLNVKRTDYTCSHVNSVRCLAALNRRYGYFISCEGISSPVAGEGESLIESERIALAEIWKLRCEQRIVFALYAQPGSLAVTSFEWDLFT